MKPILSFVLVILAGATLGVLAAYTLSGCSPAMPYHVRARVPTRTVMLGASPGSITDTACIDLMGQRDNGELAGKILAGVGGVGALAAAPESFPSGVRWGIGAAAATTAVVGVAVLWWGERKGAEFERYCEVLEGITAELAPSPFVDGGVE